MLVRRESVLASWLLIAVLLLATNGCRNRPNPGDGDGSAEQAGEPEQYSATVVRIVEDGTKRETSVSLEAHSGVQRRDEWIENGEKRALIWRPDIGKGFLLDLDRRAYVELEIGAARLSELQAGDGNPHGVASPKRPVKPDIQDSTLQAIDGYFDDAQSPTRVETQVLSPTVIDGHPCVVHEQRAVFHDGHAEITRRFRARDLSGLILRVETESDQGLARVITERRDVRIDVAPDTFIVPADFKKTERR